MGLSDTCTLTIDGVSDALFVLRMEGTERLHATYAFDITVSTEGSDGARIDILPADIIARSAVLGLSLSDGGERRIEGVIEAAEALDRGYKVRIVPAVALLWQTVDHRVFVDQDAVQIAEAVLSEHNVTLDKRVRRELPPRAQCVQAFESDLAFVARILAEEGIGYYLPLDRKDVLVLTDQPSGFEDLPGIDELTARETGGLLVEESVYHARLRQSLVSEKVTLRDYHFEKPQLDQTVSAGAGAERYEVYEYPGFYDDPSIGEERARIRLDQLRARRVVLTGETASRRLSAGYVIKIASAGRPKLNRRWLVTEVRHESSDRGASQDQRYVARFTAVPADASYRPEQPAAPTLGGIQTATTTGPSGAEIYTEPYGRVKVLYRWDRRGALDETSSTWVRVAQPPTSGGFLQPRVGWETLIAFYQKRSADDAILMGRMYNGQAVPPRSLPDEKVVTALGTLTTPGGGSANLIQMNDAAGAEEMSFVASKDFNERTENDKNTEITASDAWTVGSNRTLIVGQVLDQSIDGAQSYTIGSSRTVNVTSNKMVNAASETVMIGGLRTFNIGGDLVTSSGTLTRLVGAAKAELGIEQCARAVQGASTTLVGGSWNQLAGAAFMQNVSGASTEIVGGSKSVQAPSYTLSVRGAYNETLASRSVKAGGERQEGFGAAASYTIGGSAKMQGSSVVVKATGRITVRAGGVTITITPGSVTISGQFKGSVACKDQGEIDYG